MSSSGSRIWLTTRNCGAVTLLRVEQRKRPLTILFWRLEPRENADAERSCQRSDGNLPSRNSVVRVATEICRRGTPLQEERQNSAVAERPGESGDGNLPTQSAVARGTTRIRCRRTPLKELQRKSAAAGRRCKGIDRCPAVAERRSRIATEICYRKIALQVGQREITAAERRCRPNNEESHQRDGDFLRKCP